MKRVLVAGATGYLGGFVVRELQQREMWVRALVRDSARLNSSSFFNFEAVEGFITDPQSIEGCCRNIDVVISTVGITRQRDGVTYMDVDYQANLNLLREAKKSSVQKFIYISVLNGRELKHLKICEAKERFVAELKRSGMDFSVIRPNGFFSDMAAYLEMAKKGRISPGLFSRSSSGALHTPMVVYRLVNTLSTNKRSLPADKETMSLFFSSLNLVLVGVILWGVSYFV